MTTPLASAAGPRKRSAAATFALILLPFALAHFISYLYRTINAVVYPDLARDLSLAAGSVGLLTGAYFLMFAAAQLPVGVALDRYGPRRVQSLLLLVAACGALMFSRAESLTGLTVARGLIGLGVAGSLMAAIKASSLWLPAERLPLATAMLLSVGGMGAMASTTPLQTALQWTDWRTVFAVLAGATLLVSALIFVAVPEHPKKQQTRLSDMLLSVRDLYCAWSFWRLVLYSLVAHAIYMSIQGLWMGPWLRDVANLGRNEVASVLFAGTVAMVVGSLACGWATDVLGRCGFKPLFVCGAGICAFVAVQGMMAFHLPVNPYVVSVGFGFFGASITMNYAIVAQSVPSHLTGRVSTSFNLLIFLLAFVVQWGFGAVLSQWESQGGHYPADAYRYGLLILLAVQVPGVLLWLSFKPWRRTVVPVQG